MLKKIASNTLAQIFSKVLTALITIILLGLLTNYFSIELFWTYNKIFNYIFIFAFLVDLWLYAISVKEISQNKKNASFIFGNILSLRIISAFLVIILSTFIAYFLPSYNSKLVLAWIFLASIFSFFSLINSSILALMQAYMKIEFSIISVVLNKLFVLFFSFLVIKKIFPEEQEKWFLAIISIVAIWMFINMILNYLYAKKLTKIKFYFDKKYIKEIFYKTLPYWIALFLSVVYTKIDIILLSLMEKWAIAERSIALYSLPLKIMDVFMIIWGFFMNSLLPSLSENYKKKNFLKIKEIIENALKVMLVFWITIVSFWIIYRDNIIKIIANNDYLQTTNLNHYTSSDAFLVILFMILFFYLWIVFSYSLIAFDKQKKLLKISIILTLTNIIWNILLIPKYSFLWASIVTVITQIIFLFLVFFETRKYIEISFPYKFIIFTIIFWIINFLILFFLTSKFPLWLFSDFLYAFLLIFLYFLIIYKSRIYRKFLKR